MTICRYMKGDQCAQQYCDFWSGRHGKCVTAVKDEAIAELTLGLNEAILFNPKVLDKLEDYTEMARRIKNIIK